MKVRVFVSVLISFTIIFSGCGFRGISQNSNVIVNNVFSPEEKARIAEMISLSYSEKNNVCGFGYIDKSLLNPDLYTTFASVGIMNLLNRKIPDREPIINFIKSIYKRDGYFSDSRIPKIIQTFWAVKTAQRLGFGFDKIKTKAIEKFIESHRLPDGTFFSDDSKNENLELRISYTLYCIETELILNKNNLTRNRNKQLIKTLESYINSKIAKNINLSPSNSSGFIITAIYEEALLGYRISAKYKKVLKEYVNEIPSLQYGFLNMALTNNLIQCTHYSEIAIPGKVKNFLYRQYMKSFNISIGSFEPMIAYILTDLFKNTSLDIPQNKVETIESLIRSHRVSGGYAKFVKLNPDPEYTYFALYLIRSLDLKIPILNKERIFRYLESVLYNPGKFSLSGSVYAAKGISRIYGKRIDRTKIVEGLRQYANLVFSNSTISNREKLLKASEMATLYKMAGITFSETPSEFKREVNFLLNNTKNMSYWDIYVSNATLLLSKFTNSSKVKDLSLRKLKSLYCKNGFKKSPESHKPDLISTGITIENLNDLKIHFPEWLNIESIKSSVFSKENDNLTEEYFYCIIITEATYEKNCR